MSTETTPVSSFITCPDVADGNPWMMYATVGILKSSGIPAEAMLLNGFSTSVVGSVHGAMTRNPWLAARYTQDSERRRNGRIAGGYSRLAFGEVVKRVGGLGIEAPTRWIATQEHPLLGADAATLDKLGITDIDLIVADSYPKESAVRAVMEHERATMYVWNADAHHDLFDRGVRAELISPRLIEGITRQKQLPANGLDVIAKTSGSGMASKWTSALVIGLTRAWRETHQDHDFDWSLYTPAQRYSNLHAEIPLTHRQRRLAEICGSIGLNTSLVIGFPTELVAVVAEARSRGAPIQLLAGPPRGKHEVENLRFAHKHGLLLGEIDFTGTHEPTIPGTRRVPIAELADVVREAIETTPPALSPGVLGKVDYAHHRTVATAA